MCRRPSNTTLTTSAGRQPRQAAAAPPSDERRLGGSHARHRVPRREEGTRALRSPSFSGPTRAGDSDAFDRVVPLVYDELRRLARRHLRRGPAGYTLDTNGLVHEAYLKLAASEGLELKDRGPPHGGDARASCGRCSWTARARGCDRSAGPARPPRSSTRSGCPRRRASAERLLDVDSALQRLRERDLSSRASSNAASSGASRRRKPRAPSGLSLRTAQRGWMRARAWLRAELGPVRESTDRA